MDERILRNMESAQYIYAAKKTFRPGNGVFSESDSKILICHTTDMHNDLKRFENSLFYADYFGADFMIHTGDTVEWDMNTSYGYYKEAALVSKFPMYNCIGNHETFKGGDKPSNEYLHSELIDGLKDIRTSNGRGYYYVDFDKYTLRLIVLNDYDFDVEGAGARESYCISQTQCDWLIDVLKEAAEKGYAVIIASHESELIVPPGSNDFGFCQRDYPHPWGPSQKHEHIVSDIVDAFKHGKELKLDLTYAASGLSVSLDTKFEKCGEFVCYLNGHRHGDFVGYHPDFPDQLSVCLTCSGCYPKGEYFHKNIGEETSDLPRIPGTVSEDCVNFYTIDREKKIFSIVRIGAAVNDEFKVRRAMQVHY